MVEQRGVYSLVVNKVVQHLLKIGAIPKEKQASKKGWKLDGEIINLERPNNPSWFAFNKLRKLFKSGTFTIESFQTNFSVTDEQIKYSGAARSAIWIHCSVGEKTIISIVNWLREQNTTSSIDWGNDFADKDAVQGIEPQEKDYEEALRQRVQTHFVAL